MLATSIEGKAQTRSVELSEADVQQATRDSVRALMMIRAYRMRGHLHAHLDPLGIEAKKDHEELDPASYGFSAADMDRKIFIDHVLGWNSRPSARCLHPRTGPIADHRRRVHAHHRSGRERPGFRNASKARTRKSPSPAKASAPSSTSWSRPRASRSSSTCVYRHQALRPRWRRSADPGAGADHQARRQARRARDRARHGPSRPPQRADAGDGKPHRALFHEFKGGSAAPAMSKARAT
jgi:hypothetical protein